MMLADVKGIAEAASFKTTNDLLLCKFCVPPTNNHTRLQWQVANAGTN
jgi:hypothetical protein